MSSSVTKLIATGFGTSIDYVLCAGAQLLVVCGPTGPHMYVDSVSLVVP